MSEWKLQAKRRREERQGPIESNRPHPRPGKQKRGLFGVELHLFWSRPWANVLGIQALRVHQRSPSRMLCGMEFYAEEGIPFEDAKALANALEREEYRAAKK